MGGRLRRQQKVTSVAPRLARRLAASGALVVVLAATPAAGQIGPPAAPGPYVIDVRAATSQEQLLNALYRLVEMMQIFVTVSDPELVGHVRPIAARFQEEDRHADLLSKLRNGFCRLFELGHMLASQLDANL